ncbi:phosphoglycolate phosphatase [Polaromonas sp. OV174]|uniref:phosphoglycolate phosphatase n=1 Tax=Polaromonas sp. OV174 TaxID=1855300 RepID=UPI0008E47ADA|nr:phosphoglycolate phosphatase [Polaromonas sp. OV174]SFC79097.1 phosphoglycolate phosphatase [Polaromonas sp. OV174]
MNSITLNHGDYDAAIVDLDGTLVDTMGDFVAALNLMLADVLPQGLATSPLDVATVSRMVGKGSEYLVKSVLNHVQSHAGQALPAIDLVAQYEPAFASYQKHYDRINGLHSALYPGVLEGLRGLQQAGLPMLCLTNKPLAFARLLLKLKGLDGFFSEVFGGDSFERKKPDPLPLLKACEFLGTQPGRTLMIGDSSNDAQAARAAGCPVLLLTYGYNHGEPVRAVDADGFLDSLAQLQLRP